MSDSHHRFVDWRLKCAAMHLFGVRPIGPYLHYFAQRFVTNSLQRTIWETRASLRLARRHVETFRQHYGNFRNANYFEFGAGWDLFTNIVLHAYGVSQQFVVDLRPYARMNLVNDAIAELRDLPVDEFDFRNLSPLRGDFVKALREQYGITYAAPYDARKLNLPNDSVDLISTTNTLEHIPESDLLAIMRECARVCHSHSIVSMIIDYSDHYAHSDPTLTPYNFLKFSERSWRLFNPPIHFQNRLRHSDYRKLFLQAGFAVVKETSSASLSAPTDLTKIPLAEKFQSYAPEELVKVTGHFVLRKICSAQA